MKIAAHPLVVAAALGLVGPVALEEDDAAPNPCVDCPGETDDYRVSLEEMARAEHAFEEASARLDSELR